MKTKLLLFTSLLSLNLMAQIPTDSLVGYYPFSGNANDYSTKGNNGTVNGATLTTDRFGNANSAYSFSGTNDNISIPTITQTNILKYSVSGWFQKNSPSVNSEGNIFCGSNYPTTKGLRFHIGSTNQAAFGVEDTGGNSVWSYSQNQNYADNNWHFFTIVFDANAGVVDSTELKIYIDNAEIPKIQKVWGVQSNVTAPVNNSNLPTILGNVTGGGDHFQGKLDDIRIYNKVLDSTEITYLFYESPCYNNITIYDTTHVTVHDTLHISVTDTLKMNIVLTGISAPNNTNTVIVYPNPTHNNITVDFGNYSSMTGYSIKINNSLGQPVYSNVITQQSTNIDLSSWTIGTYFINIVDNNNITVSIKTIILQ